MHRGNRAFRAFRLGCVNVLIKKKLKKKQSKKIKCNSLISNIYTAWGKMFGNSLWGFAVKWAISCHGYQTKLTPIQLILEIRLLSL